MRIGFLQLNTRLMILYGIMSLSLFWAMSVPLDLHASRMNILFPPNDDFLGLALIGYLAELATRYTGFGMNFARNSFTPFPEILRFIILLSL